MDVHVRLYSISGRPGKPPGQGPFGSMPPVAQGPGQSPPLYQEPGAGKPAERCRHCPERHSEQNKFPIFRLTGRRLGLHGNYLPKDLFAHGLLSLTIPRLSFLRSTDLGKRDLTLSAKEDAGIS